MLDDLKFGLRLLLKSPGFVFVAVFSLALGMAVNTAVFTLLNAFLFKPLPITHTEGLVYLFNSSPANAYGNSSYPRYQAYANQNDVFSGLMAYSPRPVALTDGDQTKEVNAEVVSENYFSVLEVQPYLGRLFSAVEGGKGNSDLVAVLSHDFWMRRYGSDPSIVGQTVMLNGHHWIVAGIASKDFTGLNSPLKTDLWVPVEPWTISVQEQDRITNQGHSWIEVMGRLKPALSPEQAEAAMNAIAEGLGHRSGDDLSANPKVILTPAIEGHPKARTELMEIAIPFAAGGFLIGTLVLLIGCANAANLFAARGASRRKELAIRVALGCTRWKLIRLLLTESLVLASLAGVTGLLFATWGIELLLKVKIPVPVPEFSFDLGPDLRVFGFAFALSLVAAVLFGLAPALRISRSNLTTAINDQRTVVGRGAVRFTPRNILVASQAAMSLLLLIVAGLFARSLHNAESIDPGFDTSNVHLLSLAPDQFGMNIQKPERMDEELLERARSLSFIQSATLADPVPLSFNAKAAYFEIEGTSDLSSKREALRLSYAHIAPGYFKTLGIPLIKGRDFVDQDSAAAHKVTIVNDIMATRFWPNQDPVGRRIINDGQPMEIVGVARTTKYRMLGEPPEPVLYIPTSQTSKGDKIRATLLVRSELPSATVAAGLKRELDALASNWPVFELKSLADSVSIQVFLPRLAAGILGALGLLGLLLALVGIYGLVSYSVTLRTHEIGIRMALGARSPQVLRLIISQSIVLTLVGIMGGGAVAAGITRFLATLLIGISSTDPLTFATVPLALLSATTLASVIPARRALNVDPVEALRHE